MFKGANTFNQNLGTWEIRSLRFAGNMLDDCGLSAANYSSTLDGWFANETTPESIFLGAENMAYCTTFGREGLITTKNWTIFGDSPCELEINSFSPENEFYLAEAAQTSIYVIFDQPVQESENFEDISITLEGSQALNLESSSFSGDTLYIYQGPLSLGTYEIIVPENAVKSLVLQGNAALSWTFVNLGPLSAANTTLQTSIYPNPFSQHITFSFEMPEAGEVSLVLRDMAGREVYSSSLPNAQQGRQELKVNRGNIPQGVYLYEIRSGQYRQSGRIIAQ